MHISIFLQGNVAISIKAAGVRKYVRVGILYIVIWISMPDSVTMHLFKTCFNFPVMSLTAGWHEQSSQAVVFTPEFEHCELSQSARQSEVHFKINSEVIPH